MVREPQSFAYFAVLGEPSVFAIRAIRCPGCLVITMKKSPADGSSKLDPCGLRADLRRNGAGFRGEPAYSLSAYSLTAFPSHP